jgi:hypothetical protein
MGRQALRSRYFQEIAQAFFDLRGAPFVLSSRDMVAISSWEERGIPLRVVLEGIRRAFESYRKRQAGGRKMSSLSYCNAEVLKTFAEFRDRSVGRRSGGILREGKKKKAKTEVDKFLTCLPPEVGWLKDIYGEARRALCGITASEEALDKMEANVEDLILRKAPEADKTEVEKRIQAEYRSRPGSEARDILRVRLIQFIREKYKIPHLSLFYY